MLGSFGRDLGVFGFIRVGWVPSVAPCGKSVSFRNVGCIRARPGGFRVVWFIRERPGGRWVHSGAP